MRPPFLELVFKFRNDKNGARLAIPVNHTEECGDIVDELAIKDLGSKTSLKVKNSNEVLVGDIEGCEKTVGKVKSYNTKDMLKGSIFPSKINSVQDVT